MGVQDSTDMSPTGWAAGVMHVLNIGTQMVGLSLLAALGTLAGLVVAGVMPTFAAAGILGSELVSGRPIYKLWGSFWREWKNSWVRANLLGIPFLVFALLLWLDLRIAWNATGNARPLLITLPVIVALYVLSSVFYFPTVATRYEDSLPRSWRFLALAPVLFPAATFASLVSVVALAVVYYFVPFLAALTAGALPAAVVTRVVRDRLLQTD